MIFYTLGIKLYHLLIQLYAPFDAKAAAWVQGRKEQFNLWQQPLPKANRAWFHFASLGEFEQGRNIMEALKQQHPSMEIVITFFSPSGYEQKKNYSLAKEILYLPIDSESNARMVLDHFDPSFIFFNKYEYWHYYIHEAHTRKIPLFVNSAIFRRSQIYFKPWGAFYRQILHGVRHFFCQDESSASLLQEIGIKQTSVTGDTRFDRVFLHQQNAKPHALIQEFAMGKKVMVAGSTWPADEEVLIQVLNEFPHLHCIFVPHEITKEKISSLCQQIKEPYTIFSSGKIESGSRILIVDAVGYLSSAYQVAKYAYVGGAFGKGLHNILEPAAFGVPIYFGPKFSRFLEAQNLIALGGAQSISNASELNKHLHQLENNEAEYQKIANISASYVASEKGATEKIIQYLQEEKYI